MSRTKITRTKMPKLDYCNNHLIELDNYITIQTINKIIVVPLYLERDECIKIIYDNIGETSLKTLSEYYDNINDVIYLLIFSLIQHFNINYTVTSAPFDPEVNNNDIVAYNEDLKNHIKYLKYEFNKKSHIIKHFVNINALSLLHTLNLHSSIYFLAEIYKKRYDITHENEDHIIPPVNFVDLQSDMINEQNDINMVNEQNNIKIVGKTLYNGFKIFEPCIAFKFNTKSIENKEKLLEALINLLKEIND